MQLILGNLIGGVIITPWGHKPEPYKHIDDLKDVLEQGKCVMTNRGKGIRILTVKEVRLITFLTRETVFRRILISVCWKGW